jgi:Sulfotransferase domain
MPKCNLIIPRFPKSGTASLHSYLALHPDICMCEPKEPSFFAVSEAWKRGPEWYDGFFDDQGEPRQWYGDSSTIYSVWEPALERIKQLLHAPKLIVLLRDPVQRLISHYKWYWAYGWESRPILRAVKEDEENEFHPDKPIYHLNSPCSPWVNPCGGYLRASRYSRFCPVMDKLFGKENILYLRNDQLATDPQATMNQCFQFLGLPEQEVPRDLRANVTDDVRLQRSFGIGVFLKPFSKDLRDRLDPGGRLRRRVKNLLGQKKRKPPDITNSDKAFFAQLLAEDTAFYETMFLDSDENGPVRRKASAARS